MVSDWRRDHNDALDRRPNYRQSDHWWDIRSGTPQSARAACSEELGIKRKAGHPSGGGDGRIKSIEHNAIRTKHNLLYGNCGVATVPVFKAVTHLPPFMGILLNLGVLWLAGELIHRRKSDDEKEHLVLAEALQRIDMPSIVFFLRNPIGSISS